MRPSDILERFEHPRLLVVGDLMLDEYLWGDAGRVSPEAPVLVLRAMRREVRLGGAASVAALARGLEAEVSIVGGVGDDTTGRTVRELIRDDGICATGVATFDDRPTTLKQRFLGLAGCRHPQQILRVDHESEDSLNPSVEARLVTTIREQIAGVDAVLISDYGKGVCTPPLLNFIIAEAKARRIPVLVDPARGADYRQYAGATVIVPNRPEAAAVWGEPIATALDAELAGRAVLDAACATAAIVKLDRDGMVFVPHSGLAAHFETEARDVYDVTGAGDVVLAVLGLCLASSVDLSDAVAMANVAAGLEVERWGVVPITRTELKRKLEKDLCPAVNRQSRIQDSCSKIVSLDEATSIAREHQNAGRRVVFTNGCFDLLHAGHVRCLREAAALGDVLIVGVNSDESVRRLKGPSRPVIGEQDRLELLAALACVDHVLIFGEPTPHELLRKIRPDLLVKGGTYTREEVVGHEIVEQYGGAVRVVGAVEGRSTTAIVRTIAERDGGTGSKTSVECRNEARIPAHCES